MPGDAVERFDSHLKKVQADPEAHAACQRAAAEAKRLLLRAAQLQVEAQGTPEAGRAEAHLLAAADNWSRADGMRRLVAGEVGR